MAHGELSDEAMQQIQRRIATIPVFASLGFRDVQLSYGGASAVVPRHKNMDGIIHTFHGGLLMTVADSVAGLAVLTTTGPNARIATTHMSMSLLNPATRDVRATATVLVAGRRISVCTVEIHQGRKHIAQAEVTYAVMDRLRQTLQDE